MRVLLYPTDVGGMRATEYEWVSYPLSRTGYYDLISAYSQT